MCHQVRYEGVGSMPETNQKILKVKPPLEYPIEDGSYLRGNDLSPVAVCVLLHTFYDKIPAFLQELAKTGVESGAALSGYLQTENVGIEKSSATSWLIRTYDTSSSAEWNRRDINPGRRSQLSRITGWMRKDGSSELKHPHLISTTSPLKQSRDFGNKLL